jgi:hypothetical protein
MSYANPFFSPPAIQYSTIGGLTNPRGGCARCGSPNLYGGGLCRECATSFGTWGYGTEPERFEARVVRRPARGKADKHAAARLAGDARAMGHLIVDSGACRRCDMDLGTAATTRCPAGGPAGPYRTNPGMDDELRALERSAAMGDTVAAERLAVMQGRMHVPQYEIKCDECKTEIGRTDSMAQSAAGGLCAACRSHRGRSIRFMQHFVTDGVTKAAVTYSAGQMYGATRGDPFRLGVTLYAKTFPDGDKLKAVFAHHYRNRTDFASDLFDRGAVTFYEGDPLYPAALARAQENAARDQVRHAATHARRAARGRSNPCPYLERFESNPPHENTIAYEHLPDGMVLSTVRLGPYRVGGGGSFETAVLYPSGGTAEVHRSASEDEALATHVRVARKYNKGRVDTSRPGWVRSMMGLQNPRHAGHVAYDQLPGGLLVSTVNTGRGFETAVMYQATGGTRETHRTGDESEALAMHERMVMKHEGPPAIDTSRPGWVRSMMGLQPSRFNPRASAPRMFTPISMGKARRLAAEYSGVAVFVGPRGMEFRVVGEGEAERLTEALEAEIMGHYPNGQASYGPGDEPGFWSVHAWPDYANL